MRPESSGKRGVVYLLLIAAAMVVAYRFDLIGRAAYAVERGRIQAEHEHLSRIAPSEVAALENLSRAYNLVASAIRPSVVNISAKVRVKETAAHREMRRFFRGDDDGSPVAEGTGSGVIIDNAGHIVTNNHVVGNAERIDVTFSDGRKTRARIVGTDPMTDLAVIQAETDRLIPARFGDSEVVRVGDVVLAIGSPFRLDQTVSHGIISARGRNVLSLDIDYQDFLQTDAPINPGNSGGPLVNTRGEVIGINTAIATDSGGYQGIGFSIPANKVRQIAQRLIRDKRIRRGYLGVKIRDVDDVLAERAGVKDAHGALVDSVLKEGPAARAGLKGGDVIVAVNERSVVNHNALSEMIANTAPDTDVTLTLYRDGKEMKLTVRVLEQPEGFSTQTWRQERMRPRVEPPSGDDEDDDEPMVRRSQTRFDQLGIEVRTLSPERAAELGYEGIESGAIITQIDPTGDAWNADLRHADVIVKVDRQRVRNAADLKRVLNDEALARGVRLLVKNNTGSHYVGLRVR